MIERLLKLYTMYMLFDVRSPMPHLEGPPGCGKTTVLEQLAEMVGVNYHVINVSRLSPLEVEGVMMPHTSGEELVLKMLPASFWTSLCEGDVLNLDEFLRGFPEVYNALLDILTSRKAGHYQLPKVFIVGASNSATAYDAALEDRLLHLPVADPRHDRQERLRIAEMLVDSIGLHPAMRDSMEMNDLLQRAVLPMFNVLDTFKGGAPTGGTSSAGKSVRNLIGQVKLREIQTPELASLLEANNRHVVASTKWQYLVLPHGKQPPTSYKTATKELLKPKTLEKLTDLQRLNLIANLSLIEAEESKVTITTTREEAEVNEFIDLD